MSPVAAIVQRHDPDRFFAALFAPAEQRESLFLLCAFNHELARAREVASQPMLARIRLHWWREIVEGTRRRHEVAGPLGEALDSGVFQPADLLAMIDARDMETDDSIPDLASWHAYLAGTAGGLAVAAGRLLGAEPDILPRLRSLGAAYGAAGQILNVAALARQERCLLPEDVLDAHGLTPSHVLHNPASAAPVLAQLTQEALRLMQAGAGRYPGAVIAAALPSVLARRDLRRGRHHRGGGDKLAVVVTALLGRV